ncbi:MAG: glycosyltransferase family 2 protein [Candidatus Daviesbacteria bacterium]
MRILVSLVLGLISAFFLTEMVVRAWRKLPLTPKFPYLHHSSVGVLVLLVAILTFFIGPSLVGNSNSAILSTLLIGSGLGIIIHHVLSESFFFSKTHEHAFLSKHSIFVERVLEIIPGALTWLALTSPIWLSFTLPFAVAYIILLADIYWLFSACRIAVLIYVAYKKFNYAKKQDWLARLKTNFPGEWENYYHVLVIPTYKESLEVLKPAFDAIVSSNYPKEKIFIGVGLEERDFPEKIAQVQKYWRENEHKIGGAFVTIHPYGLPGELAGPATNRNFIVNNAVKEFKKRGVTPDQVIVTTLDADFVIHEQFLAGALHKYLSQPEKVRYHRSFTGVFLYNNNYWQCPAPMRLIASGTAYWQMSEMVGSDKYINFSSLSMNMKSLLDIGLWIPDKVNDDSGFYWKAYFHYNGDYKVIPHFLPISADTVLDVSLWKTFTNQYLQLKRWAYGVEHMPFIIKQYFKKTDMDFWDKTDKLIFITWSYMKWGTLAFFITFAGIIIPHINQNYSESVVSINLPVISSWILTGAFIGLFSTIYAHEKTVPKRPENWNFFQKAWSFLQWALIPLILVTIASIPAIDAQTRLMLGKYMEFRVTNKARV